MSSAEHAFSPLAEVPANIYAPPSDVTSDGRRLQDTATDHRQLINEARRGDRDAFGAIYRHYHDAIYRFARFRLNGPPDDAVSETFIRAWAALPRYRDTGAPFSAWLYGIARHVVTDELRARGRVEPREELPDVVVESHPENALLVASLLERLPDDQRRVIEMKFLLGMPNPEVASALRKSIGAINALQWRALRSLRRMLEGDE